MAGEPTLVVSLARSGESPESAAVVQRLLETEPNTTHLILTCNAEGKLARKFAGNPRVQVVSLSEEVHDHSLVMTSSFANLALSERFLGWLDSADEFAALAVVSIPLAAGCSPHGLIAWASSFPAVSAASSSWAADAVSGPRGKPR